MPLELHFERNGAGAIVTGNGLVRGDEFIAINARMYAPDNLRGLRYQLIDLTQVERQETTTAQLQICAEQDRRAAEQNPNLIVAVAGPDDLSFGLSRMWEGFVSDAPLRTRVFRSVPEARTWIESMLFEDMGPPPGSR